MDAAGELKTLLSDDLRKELYRHCLQMLGSVEDAEDALQEVLVRIWRGLDGFERRSSFRTWAHRIAINVCLSALRSRARRPPSVADGAEIEETSAGPGRDASSQADVTLSGSPHERYERHESVELAVIAVLHHLPPNQRAALMMRDVLGFTAQESAAALGTSTAAVNSALQHARATIGRLDTAISTAAVPATPDTVRLVGQYVAALEEADLAALLRLVGEDTSWAMPPFHAVYRRSRGDREVPAGRAADLRVASRAREPRLSSERRLLRPPGWGRALRGPSGRRPRDRSGPDPEGHVVPRPSAVRLLGPPASPECRASRILHVMILRPARRLPLQEKI